jgi:DNA-directed RNA polymerase specialized sigma24 family protein
MQEPGTITAALMALKDQDDQAIELLWQRFFERLCGYAESRIYRRHRRLIDPDQIATDAFMALVDGVQNHRFEKVRNRDELWQMLTLIAARKTIVAHRRLARQKRGGGNLRGDSVFQGSRHMSLQDFASDEITPAVMAELEELSGILLDELNDDSLRQIAILRMAGHSNGEIAQKLSVSERTVERKLRMIRKVWNKLSDSENLADEN